MRRLSFPRRNLLTKTFVFYYFVWKSLHNHAHDVEISCKIANIVTNVEKTTLNGQLQTYTNPPQMDEKKNLAKKS